MRSIIWYLFLNCIREYSILGPLIAMVSGMYSHSFKRLVMCRQHVAGAVVVHLQIHKQWRAQGIFCHATLNANELY